MFALPATVRESATNCFTRRQTGSRDWLTVFSALRYRERPAEASSVWPDDGAVRFLRKLFKGTRCSGVLSRNQRFQHRRNIAILEHPPESAGQESARVGKSTDRAASDRNTRFENHTQRANGDNSRWHSHIFALTIITEPLLVHK